MVSTHVATGAARPSPMRRRRIVDAATRLFATTRYDAVQIDDVARAAGVAKPTLYRYFATKEDLFLEGLDRLLGEVADEMTAAAEASGSARQALPKMIRILLERIGSNSSGVRMFDGGERRFGALARNRLRARARQIRGNLAAVLQCGIAQGEFREIDPEFVALAIIGSLRMIATKIPARQRAAAASAVVDMLVSGIASDAAQEMSAPPLQGVAQIALDVG